jgi:hypothetical protein
MKDVNDGGPAFPTITSEVREFVGESAGVIQVDKPGMSLRDYFAAKAMQAILASTYSSLEMVQVVEQIASSMGRQINDHIAILSYARADAMLAARNK